MATRGNKPVDMELVSCDTCLKEIPRSEAVVPEATEYVVAFCGLECYEKWKSRLGPEERAAPAARKSGPTEAPPEPEIQLGRERGVARDERIKEIVRQHPQREEPRIDSVEENEIPPA